MNTGLVLKKTYLYHNYVFLYTDLMDSSSKDRRDRNPNHVLQYDEAQYTVSYAHRRSSEEVS